MCMLSVFNISVFSLFAINNQKYKLTRIYSKLHFAWNEKIEEISYETWKMSLDWKIRLNRESISMTERPDISMPVKTQKSNQTTSLVDEVTARTTLRINLARNRCSLGKKHQIQILECHCCVNSTEKSLKLVVFTSNDMN